jgi:hypothetical protein
VTTAFATLCANDIGASSESLLDVLGRTDHVHIGNAGSVQLVDRPARRHADGRDEQLGTRLDDNIDQLRQLAIGIVAIGLACTAANLRQQQIDAKRSVLVDQVLLCQRLNRGEGIEKKIPKFVKYFQLGDLTPQEMWRIANTTKNTQLMKIKNKIMKEKKNQFLTPPALVTAAASSGLLR